MRWTWDKRKSRINKRKHGVGFEVACLVFDDPLALSHPDTHPDGDRWQTIGLVRREILAVIHTWPDLEFEDGDLGRIISARRATSHERRAYEDETP